VQKSTVPKRGKFYLLTVGIDEYQNHTPLEGAKNGAREYRKILEDKYGFTDIRELEDQEANADAIHLAIRAYITGNRDNARDFEVETPKIQLSKEDSLIIWLSGHGDKDEKDETSTFFIPYDGVEISTSNWLDHSRFLKYIRKIKAKKILLISDSCFSGGLLGYRKSKLSSNSKINATDVKLTSRQVVTSGGLEFVPDRMPEEAQSYFAKALLKVLEEFEGPVLKTHTLFENIMAEYSSNEYQGIARPRFGHLPNCDGQGGEFLFFNSLYNDQREHSKNKTDIQLEDQESLWRKQKIFTLSIVFILPLLIGLLSYANFTRQSKLNIANERQFEKQALTEAQAVDTVEAYTDLLANFPSLEEIALARIEKIKTANIFQEDQNAYLNAISDPNEGALLKYLNKFPDGTYADNVRARIEILSNKKNLSEKQKADQVAWALAREENSIKAYQKYLNGYPNGAYSPEASIIIEYAEKSAQNQIRQLREAPTIHENLQRNFKVDVDKSLYRNPTAGEIINAPAGTVLKPVSNELLVQTSPPQYSYTDSPSSTVSNVTPSAQARPQTSTSEADLKTQTVLTNKYEGTKSSTNQRKQILISGEFGSYYNTKLSKIGDDNLFVLVGRLGIRLDADGLEISRFSFNDQNIYKFGGLEETQDKGLVLVGQTSSGFLSSDKAVAIKLNRSGDISWRKTYGIGSDSELRAAIQTNDGGYLLVGSTKIKENDQENVKALIVKTGQNGRKIWHETYGIENARALSAAQLKTGEYIVSGYVFEDDGINSRNPWVQKISTTGTKIWSETWESKYGSDVEQVILGEDSEIYLVGDFQSQKSQNSICAAQLSSSGKLNWERSCITRAIEVGLLYNSETLMVSDRGTVRSFDRNGNEKIAIFRTNPNDYIQVNGLVKFDKNVWVLSHHNPTRGNGKGNLSLTKIPKHLN